MKITKDVLSKMIKEAITRFEIEKNGLNEVSGKYVRDRVDNYEKDSKTRDVTTKRDTKVFKRYINPDLKNKLLSMGVECKMENYADWNKDSITGEIRSDVK